MDPRGGDADTRPASRRLKSRGSLSAGREGKERNAIAVHTGKGIDCTHSRVSGQLKSTHDAIKILE